MADLGEETSAQKAAREREPLVHCTSCGWSTRASSASITGGKCGYCADLDRLVRKQKKRIATWRNTPRKEQEALAAQLQSIAEKYSADWKKTYRVCKNCKEVFSANERKNDAGQYVLVSKTTSVCEDCTSVAECLRQWKERKEKRVCEACHGSGGKKNARCVDCGGRGFLTAAETEKLAGERAEEPF